MSETKETHVHVLEDGTILEHSHGEHGHHHSHAQTKAVLNRLSRAIGHLESIKRMVEDGRDCSEVLIQLSAVKSAINNTGKIILQDHIEHCIVDAVTAVPAANQAARDAQAKKRVIRRILWQNRMFFQM